MPETAGYVFFTGYPVEAGCIRLFLAFLFIKRFIKKIRYIHSDSGKNKCGKMVNLSGKTKCQTKQIIVHTTENVFRRNNKNTGRNAQKHT